MSDDPTKELPGKGKEMSGNRNDDRIDLLITAVQSLASEVQTLKTEVQTLRTEVQTLRTEVQTLSTEVQYLKAETQEIKSRLTVLETTTNARSLETKPIWERALAEIAALRVELAETRTDLRNEMRDGFRKLGAKMDVCLR